MDLGECMCCWIVSRMVLFTMSCVQVAFQVWTKWPSREPEILPGWYYLRRVELRSGWISGLIQVAHFNTNYEVVGFSKFFHSRIQKVIRAEGERIHMCAHVHRMYRGIFISKLGKWLASQSPIVAYEKHVRFCWYDLLHL